MGKEVAKDYEDIIKANPKVGDFFFRQDWDIMHNTNEFLRKELGKMWKRNLRKNLDGLFQKHRTISADLKGIGSGKATIAIGAGSSFNKNKDVLKAIYFSNMELPFEEQPFIFVASNHMYKPLLKMGIAPHFVMLCDGSRVVYDQLCKDIPKHGRGSILLCPLRADWKVLKEWDRQGRMIKFYMGDNEWMMAEFEKKMGFSPKTIDMTMSHGGNVMNQTFQIALGKFDSTVYMCVGNDCSYDYHADLDDRRKHYYADKDYSSNLGTGRDEAKQYFPWMGYELEQSIIDPTYHTIRFVPKATTQQLVMYKMWVENQVTIQNVWKKRFHYYNCTEGGILGVLSRKDTLENNVARLMSDKDNWYLLDEVTPESYHTTTLAKACNDFLYVQERRMEESWRTNLCALAPATAF